MIAVADIPGQARGDAAYRVARWALEARYLDPGSPAPGPLPLASGAPMTPEEILATIRASITTVVRAARFHPDRYILDALDARPVLTDDLIEELARNAAHALVTVQGEEP